MVETRCEDDGLGFQGFNGIERVIEKGGNDFWC